MRIYSTGGTAQTNLIGSLPGYGTVWFHPDSIANILSLAKVKKNRVTYDSAGSDSFDLHMSNGIRSFAESDTRLFYLYIKAPKYHVVTTLVNTVAANKTKYNNRDYSRAVTARKLQSIVANPSYDHFRKIIQSKELRNFPVTELDVVAAEDIFGLSLQILKEKTPRSRSTHVQALNVTIPPIILDRYKFVILTGDIMKVNG